MSTAFPYRYRVLILLFFLLLITSIDRICISLLGVRIKTEFGLSNEQFGWVLGAFALAYGLFEIPAGALADRIGQKKVFIRIVLCWSFFTALTGATTGLGSLLITRFLFGMGEAGAFPTATGTVARWMPAKETARGTSWLLIGSSTGAALAPFFVIPIAQAYGWRTSFFANGFIGLFWVLICLAWFNNEPSGMPGISPREKHQIETNRRYSRVHNGPFPWKTALRDKNLLTLLIAYFCSHWAFFFFIAWMPIYLQSGKHFTENAMRNTTSALFVIGILGGITGGFFNDWLVQKRGLKFARRFIGFTCLAIMSVCFFTAAIAENPSITSAAILFAYFFMPNNGTNSFATCVDIGENKASTVAGLMNFAGSMGGFLLTIFFGKLADVTGSFDIPVFVIAAILGIGSLLWFVIDPTKKIVSTETIAPPVVQLQ